MAVKCYLCAATAGQAALSDYVGPNLADRFDLKYWHLVDLSTAADQARRIRLHRAGRSLGRAHVREGLAVLSKRRAAAGAGRARRGASARFLGRARRLAGTRWVLLPRLAWLAPRRLEADDPLVAVEVLARCSRRSWRARHLRWWPP
ncbi:MAG: DUF1853 family protein [Burkholderia sp.]